MRSGYDETDKILFLVSTDFFSSVISSLGLWPDIDSEAQKNIRSAAREQVNFLLGSASSYFDVDLSDHRRKQSYDGFLRAVKSSLSHAAFESLQELASQIQGSDDISSNSLWAVKAFFLSEMASGFKSDLDGLIDDDLRRNIGNEIQKLDGVLFGGIQSKWDISLSGRFGGLSSFIEDYIESNVSPIFFLRFLAFELSELMWTEEKIDRLGQLISDGVAYMGVALEPTRASGVLKLKQPD